MFLLTSWVFEIESNFGTKLSFAELSIIQRDFLTIIVLLASDLFPDLIFETSDRCVNNDAYKRQSDQQK